MVTRSTNRKKLKRNIIRAMRKPNVGAFKIKVAKDTDAVGVVVHALRDANDYFIGTVDERPIVWESYRVRQGRRDYFVYTVEHIELSMTD